MYVILINYYYLFIWLITKQFWSYLVDHLQWYWKLKNVIRFFIQLHKMTKKNPLIYKIWILNKSVKFWNLINIKLWMKIMINYWSYMNIVFFIKLMNQTASGVILLLRPVAYSPVLPPYCYVTANCSFIEILNCLLRGAPGEIRLRALESLRPALILRFNFKNLHFYSWG